MIFTELRFLGFFLLVFTLHWVMPWRRARHALLLAASYTFYGAWDVRFLVLIMFSTTVDFVAGQWMERTAAPARRKAIVALSLVVNLGLLSVFKYFNFFADSFVALMHAAGFSASHPTLHVILPVGISFYTFQSISYTVDVYRGKLTAERDLLKFATFVAFFPQLVAGPIVRAFDFLPQLETNRRLADVAWRPLLLLFLWGFVKKAVISDNLAPYIDAFFAQPGSWDAAAHWLATLLYAAQIYCDFSGYTDMACAVAGMLGYQLVRNFDHPYVATSPRDFWHRWHISLSTWLRDYLFIPLGGSRAAPPRVAVNLMLTMLLGGLWHGAAWTFVVWGALHGAALVVDRWTRNAKLLPASPAVRTIAGWLITMAIVLAGWVLFRAPDFRTALDVFAGMFGRGAGAGAGAGTLPRILWIYVLVLFGVQALAALGADRALPLTRLSWPRFAFAYGLLVGCTLPFVNSGYRAFIYFQF